MYVVLFRPDFFLYLYNEAMGFVHHKNHFSVLHKIIIFFLWFKMDTS